MDSMIVDLKRSVDKLDVYCRECKEPIRLAVLHQHGDIMSTTIQYICPRCWKSRWFKLRKYYPEKKQWKIVRMETE